MLQSTKVACSLKHTGFLSPSNLYFMTFEHFYWFRVCKVFAQGQLK